LTAAIILSPVMTGGLNFHEAGVDWATFWGPTVSVATRSQRIRPALASTAQSAPWPVQT
jgi:hypothetical protein